MSDNEIRQILIEKKRREAKRQKRKAMMEIAGDCIAWICWAGLIYMAFLGAYMIGG